MGNVKEKKDAWDAVYNAPKVKVILLDERKRMCLQTSPEEDM